MANETNDTKVDDLEELTEKERIRDTKIGKEILDVQNLSVDYVTEQGNIRACDNISFKLKKGEIIGIAGESASGKSTLLNAITQLQRSPAVTAAGKVFYYPSDGSKPIELVEKSENDLRVYRWNNISIVMQSAMASLNPVTKLKKQFTDVLLAHKTVSDKNEAIKIAGEYLEMVGIPKHRLNSYSYELSGGMQQRALIALSLICGPDIITMDEPTTAVDVIMQRQILKQILELQDKFNFSICFVTHDLSLLLELADRIIIMYAGKVIETARAKQIYKNPKHPYTQGLRESYPSLTDEVSKKTGIPGTPPDLLNLPKGCAFGPRCSCKIDKCEEVDPELIKVKKGWVKCWIAQEKYKKQENEDGK